MKSNSVVFRIGHYHYLKDDLVGEGSTGKVYLGVNEKTGGKVAIKIIDMNQITNQVTKYLLECEKQALKSINSAHVLRLLDIFQEEKSCYIITDYCSGGSLKQHIKQKQYLSQMQAMNIFYKLLLGYRSIKDNHFLHRDLKSSNIMLRGKQPVIIDFGYCQKTYGNKPKAYYNVGSPSYMSPQAYYKSTYSEKSDIWALGIILYEMLTGHTIDRGQQINKYFTILIKHGFSLPHRVSQSCKRIIKQCLSQNPQHRPKTTQLIKQIEQYFEKNRNFVPIEIRSQSESPNDLKLLKASRQTFLSLSENDVKVPLPEIRSKQHSKCFFPPNHANMQRQHQFMLGQSVQFVGNPHPVSRRQPGSSIHNHPKSSTIYHPVVSQRSKVLSYSQKPQIHPEMRAQRKVDLWDKTKMTQSVIFGSTNEPSMMNECSGKFVSQSMHAGNKRTPNESFIRTSFQYQNPNEHVLHNQQIMMKSQSQQANICFTGNNNAHIDFMSHAHNAFVKKSHLPVHQAQSRPMNPRNKVQVKFIQPSNNKI